MMDPLDPDVDHVRGAPDASVILEYGDYECPYSRRAYREIQRVERQLGGEVRFAFRHFPLTDIHPHALAASAAAEAAPPREWREILYGADATFREVAPSGTRRWRRRVTPRRA